MQIEIRNCNMGDYMYESYPYYNSERKQSQYKVHVKFRFNCVCLKILHKKTKCNYAPFHKC